MARVDVLGESEELKVEAKKDKATLVDSGLHPKFIDTLDERIGAYSHASSMFATSMFAKSEAKKKWDEIEGGVFDFKWDIIHYLRFALRKDEDKIKMINNISEGRGKWDLVTDLKDIASLGQKNIEALEKINFDIAKLDKAEKMHDRLSNLLADANTSPEKIKKHKKEAYQAYTYLKEAVDEIREYGQFCFWKDEDKLEKYKSDHYQRVGKTKKVENTQVM